MICKDCAGQGYFESKKGQEIECLTCDGSGNVCDVCMEPCELGMDRCVNCEEEVAP